MRLDLQAHDRRVEIGTLRVDIDELRDAAEFLLQANPFEIALGGALRMARGRDGARISLQRAQAIGPAGRSVGVGRNEASHQMAQ